MGQCRPSWCLGLLLILCTPSLSGCLATYIVKSGYEQAKILHARRPLKKVLSDPSIPDEVKRKLRLAQKARQFAEENLGFSETRNYNTYVHLGRPYVSWIVSRAHKYKLEYELFSYPIVGKLPYKGYFSKEEAFEAEQEVDQKKFDTWVRGATAYSTLGWFNDPILSSMLRGQDHDVVELILHESAHATLFIKSSADFNERLATFLGQEAARRFFLSTEGKDSPSIEKLELAKADRARFSEFLSAENKKLKKWYEERKSQPSEQERQAQFTEIQSRFKKIILPKMKTKNYAYFGKLKLNNAILLGLGTYLEDLSIFQRLLDLKNGDLPQFIEHCKGLNESSDPNSALVEFLDSQTSTQPEPSPGP